MKWILWVLAAALVLIGLDFVLGDNFKDQPLSKNPEAVSAYEAGMEDLFAYRFTDAVREFERALELDPEFAEAGIGLFSTYATMRRPEESKRYLALADSLTEKIEDPNRRMLAQLRICNASKATSHDIRDSLLTRLKQENPNSIFVLEAERNQADYGQNNEELERVLRRILEVDPNYAASYNRLGYLEMGRGNYDLALEHMQKYAFLSPDLANPHDSLGDLYRVVGRYEEAEEEYKLALQIQPDFFFSLANLGRVYLARGQVETGVDLLEKVRETVSGTDYEIEIAADIVSAYEAMELQEKMENSSADFIARYPKTRTSVMFRAIRLAYMDRREESRAVIDSALTEWRTDPSYAQSARSRLHTERRSLEYDAIVADLYQSPEHRVRAWARAIDFLDRKIEDHYQWYFRRKLARALFDAGRPAEALPVLQAQLEANPRLIYSLELAVECSLALRDADGARRLLDQLQFSLQRADRDLPVVKRASALEALVVELEHNT